VDSHGAIPRMVGEGHQAPHSLGEGKMRAESEWPGKIVIRAIKKYRGQPKGKEGVKIGARKGVIDYEL